MMHNGYDDGWVAGGSWGFWIACVLTLVVIVVAIALAVTVLWDRTPPPTPTQPLRTERSEALRVLEQRYAAGDIDDDEFRHRRTLLDA